MADLDEPTLNFRFEEMSKGVDGEALGLLRIVSRYLGSNRELPENVRMYLSKAFEEISDGKDPSVCLKLKGRISPHTFDRNLQIYKTIKYATSPTQLEDNWREFAAPRFGTKAEAVNYFSEHGIEWTKRTVDKGEIKYELQREHLSVSSLNAIYHSFDTDHFN